MRLLPIFSVIYALNMYFQSYGAVSIIKVKAHWFHVRERGVFGAIFGTLISFGVYFAFDWGQAIIDMTKLNAPMPTSAVERLLRAIFVPAGLTVDATWAVFFVPAAILVGVGVARYLAHSATRPSTPAFRISIRMTLLPVTCTRNTARSICSRRFSSTR